MVRVGFVGAGAMARRHISNLRQMPQAGVSAICDPNPSALQRAKRRTGARAYADLDLMLEKEDLDAVYVCIPISQHGEIEQRIVEKSIHIFVEKPLAYDLETAERVGRSIARSGVLSSVGYHWRYSQATEAAAREIEGRKVGMVLGFWMTGLPRQGWWTRKDQNPAQIFEQTTHLFDLSRYLVGEISEVSSRFALRTMGDASELDDVSIVSLSYENGAIGCMASTYMIPYQHPVGLLERWWLSPNIVKGKIARGSRRIGLWHRSFDTRSFRIELMIVLRDLVLQVRQASLVKTTARERKRLRDRVDPYLSESRAFIRAVSTGDRSLIRSSYEDAAVSHALVLAAIESASLGRPVRCGPRGRKRDGDA